MLTWYVPAVLQVDSPASLFDKLLQLPVSFSRSLRCPPFCVTRPPFTSVWLQPHHEPGDRRGKSFSLNFILGVTFRLLLLVAVPLDVIITHLKNTTALKHGDCEPTVFWVVFFYCNVQSVF